MPKRKSRGAASDSATTAHWQPPQKLNKRPSPPRSTSKGGAAYSSFEDRFHVGPPAPRYPQFGERLDSSSPLLGGLVNKPIAVKDMECEEARKWHEFRVFMSFWIFGCLATMQFIVVVTASNDLVGNQAPPGLILFAYTLPSVLIRAFVPYIRFPTIRLYTIRRFLRLHNSGYTRIERPENHRGHQESTDKEVNYPFRLTVCCLSSFTGLQLLSFAPNLPLRVLGIMLTSLSSNLGDMMFYQLATRYPVSIAWSFGGYAAGSGAAGLLGSGVYTLLTGIGGVETRFVLAGMGLVPAIMAGTYVGVLPAMEVGDRHDENVEGDGGEDGIGVKKKTGPQHEKIKDLAVRDKLRLVMPMVWGYMLPLATLMLLENTTIQGILPDTVFHLPLQFRSIVAGLFTSTRDFYPTYITIYQLFVFFGRTSINFVRFPNLPSPYGSMIYWGLCLFELVCFLVQLGESFSLAAAGDNDKEAWFGPGIVMTIIALMGLCGGLGMSNTYWRVSKEALPGDVWRILGEIRQKKGNVKGGYKKVKADNEDMDEEDEVDDTDLVIAEDSPTSSNLARRGRPTMRRERPTPHSRYTSFARPTLGRSRTSYLLRARSPGGTPFPEARTQRSRSFDAYGEFPPTHAHEHYHGELEIPGDVEIDEDMGRGELLVVDKEEETAMREFLISTIALPDTMAIFVASLVSLWLQPALCGVQVRGKRRLCERGAGVGS